MKKKYYLFFLITFMSCTNEKVFMRQSMNTDSSTISSSVILQERDPNSPLILNRKKTSSTKAKQISSRTPLGFTDHLGRSYHQNSLPNGNNDGFMLKIIDMEKLKSEKPSSILIRPIGQFNAHSFSYSSFDRYEEKSSYSSTINTDFSLKIGVFSAGAKNQFDKSFQGSTTKEKKNIHGELNIEKKDLSYEIQSTSHAKKEIATQYLHKSLFDELYNIPSAEFINHYGAFILTGFYTGGKALALYSGTYRGQANSSSQERSMDSSISASYLFASGSVKFGTIHSNSSSSDKKVTNLELVVKTLGGSGGLPGFTPLNTIDNINLDLSSWMASLSDTHTHSIIGITRNGIHPVSDFFLEENFKHTIQLYCENRLNDYKYSVDRSRLHTPKIEIIPLWDELADDDTDYAHARLLTRFGDHVFINTYSYGYMMGSQRDFNKHANDIKNKKRNFYNIAMESHFSQVSNLALLDRINVVNFTGMNETKMVKFKNPHNDITYLLYSGNAGKMGYAIYDDFILDTYGMRAWANTLPEVTITMRELAEYRIVGL